MNKLFLKRRNKTDSSNNTSKMKYSKTGLFILIVTFNCVLAHAQGRSEYKFGKITASDFNLPTDHPDTDVSAIIVKDIGSTNFEGNNHQGFDYVFTRYMRVKILNKNGVDAGKFVIYLYHATGQLDQNNSGYRINGNNTAFYERLYAVKASTFNLENGIIAETKMDAKSVFEERYNRNLNVKKFSLPALKEGSVFDIEYTIKSPFDDMLPSWEFNHIYPCMWSEYVVTIPPPYHYVLNYQGDQQFDIKSQREVFGSFTLKRENGTSQSDDAVINANSIELRWVKKNVPAQRKEPYISNLKNYSSRVSFQLSYFQWKTASWTGERQDNMATWDGTAKTLLQDEDFGLALDHVNNWMTGETKEITAGANSDEEKARRLYNFVRDNFKTVGKNGYNKNVINAFSPLKDVFKSREGNVAEINLLLIAMLRHEGLQADPLILSTREHGWANVEYPIIEQYNYLICMVSFGDKMIPLDATMPYYNFGQIGPDCYNGYGHIMNARNSLPVLFSADSIYETRVTSVTIMNDDKGIPSGNLKTVYGKSKSYDLREEIFGSSEKIYEKKIKTILGSDWTIENFGVDSLKKFNFPVAIHYDFGLKSLTAGDIVYFNPMLNEGYRNNPFISMDRHYPVDMAFKIDESFFLNMEIPAGYQVDEIPKSAKVAYNQNEGIFEYLIQKTETNIQMRVKIKLNKAFFPTEDYTTLRDFFAYVVKKESEQIVFKKIK